MVPTSTQRRQASGLQFLASYIRHDHFLPQLAEHVPGRVLDPFALDESPKCSVPCRRRRI